MDNRVKNSSACAKDLPRFTCWLRMKQLFPAFPSPITGIRLCCQNQTMLLAFRQTLHSAFADCSSKLATKQPQSPGNPKINADRSVALSIYCIGILAYQYAKYGNELNFHSSFPTAAYAAYSYKQNISALLPQIATLRLSPSDIRNSCSCFRNTDYEPNSFRCSDCFCGFRATTSDLSHFHGRSTGPFPS